MFGFCCDTPQETNRVPLAEIDHLNPAHRRITSRKTSRNQQQILQKSSASAKPGASRVIHHLSKKPLSKSILLPENIENNLKCTKITPKGSHSTGKTSMEIKQRLVGKASSAQQTVRLQKSKASQDHTKNISLIISLNQQKKHNKIRSQLLELKERLKKVDLSKICKHLEKSTLKIKERKPINTEIDVN